MKLPPLASWRAKRRLVVFAAALSLAVSSGCPLPSELIGDQDTCLALASHAESRTGGVSRATKRAKMTTGRRYDALSRLIVRGKNRKEDMHRIFSVVSEIIERDPRTTASSFLASLHTALQRKRYCRATSTQKKAKLCWVLLPRGIHALLRKAKKASARYSQRKALPLTEVIVMLRKARGHSKAAARPRVLSEAVASLRLGRRARRKRNPRMTLPPALLSQALIALKPPSAPSLVEKRVKAEAQLGGGGSLSRFIREKRVVDGLRIEPQEGRESTRRAEENAESKELEEIVEEYRKMRDLVESPEPVNMEILSERLASIFRKFSAEAPKVGTISAVLSGLAQEKYLRLPRSGSEQEDDVKFVIRSSICRTLSSSHSPGTTVSSLSDADVAPRALLEDLAVLFPEAETILSADDRRLLSRVEDFIRDKDTVKVIEETAEVYYQHLTRKRHRELRGGDEQDDVETPRLAIEKCQSLAQLFRKIAEEDFRVPASFLPPPAQKLYKFFASACADAATTTSLQTILEKVENGAASAKLSEWEKAEDKLAARRMAIDAVARTLVKEIIRPPIPTCFQLTLSSSL